MSAIKTVAAGKCTECGREVPSNSEPITGNGWYSGHHFVWHTSPSAGSRPVLIDVLCEEHRKRLIDRQQYARECGL
jgi:ABC-type ATPase with predicted acetyltransferase domain